MRRIAFFCLTVLLGTSFLYAQGQFKAGISGGLPIGDAGDLATFSIAVDLGYLFELSEKVDIGPITGFSHSFGDDISIGGTTVEVEDVQFVPIGGGARINISDSFTLGGDVGYAIGINDGNDGGFYYSPRAQYSFAEAVDIVFAYRGISENGGSWDILSLGVEFDLSK